MAACRPFWGALFVLVGGTEMLLTEAAPLPLVVHIGLRGVAGYVIPVVLVLSGLLLLFHPVQRTFYSLVAIILALGVGLPPIWRDSSWGCWPGSSVARWPSPGNHGIRLIVRNAGKPGPRLRHRPASR